MRQPRRPLGCSSAVFCFPALLLLFGFYFTISASLAAETGTDAGVIENANSVAPAPVLGGIGQKIILSGSWQGVAESGVAPVTVSPSEGTWKKLTLNTGKTAGIIETEAGFTAKEWHIYKIEVPLRGPCNTTATIQLRLQGGTPVELFVWPPCFGTVCGLNPAGFMTRGYAVVPQGVTAEAVVRVTLNGKAGSPGQSETRPLAEVGPPRVTDLGAVASIQPETWWTCSFENWTPENWPKESLVIAFAKPGQFGPTTENAHSGLTAGMNKEGRAYMWGSHVPCRFGTIVRIRVWARGKGSLVFSAVPFIPPQGRWNPSMETRVAVDGDWKCYEAILGQNRPETDTLVPALDINGSVTVDDWTMEKLSTPYGIKPQP